MSILLDGNFLNVKKIECRHGYLRAMIDMVNYLKFWLKQDIYEGVCIKQDRNHR